MVLLTHSPFVSHLNSGEVELSQHKEGTMIGIAIVLAGAIASFYILRFVNDN